MMEKKPLKIGLIGGGQRADSIWKTLAFDKELEEKIYVKSIFDINSNLIKDWNLKVDSTYSNLDSFLKEDLDAVLILTPPSTHASLAKKCLEIGLNVWSEVPMGLSIQELYDIIDADKSNKGSSGRYSYGENYCYLLQPQFMAMKNSKSAIGDIYFSEGEYTHSVEHYMIEENFLYNKRLDPELNPDTKPTWRATMNPITYGHAFGPCLYVLDKNSNGTIEFPVEVTAMGNMKMQKRFQTQNFQIATVKTNKDTIIKFVIGFVLGFHGRISYSFWGSRGIFVTEYFNQFGLPQHYYYEVDEKNAKYPERLEQTPQILTEENFIEMGTPHSPGGHRGGDPLMFKTLIDSWLNNKPLDIDVYKGAEMTAPGILAINAIQEKAVKNIPKFR